MNQNCKCHEKHDNRSESEFCIAGCCPKVKANLEVHQPTKAQICGRVYNQCGKPAECVTVTLYRLHKDCCRQSCRKVGMTKTDCEGRYEFQVCTSGCGEMYKVVAHGMKCCKDECKEQCGCERMHQGCGCEQRECREERDCGCGC